MRTMVIRVVELTGYAGLRHIPVSVAHVPALIDHAKWLEPSDMREPTDDTELRRQRAPRGPSLRSLVRLALACDSAEQMGLALKRRYERNAQRQGIARHPSRRDEAELDRFLGDPRK